VIAVDRRRFLGFAALAPVLIAAPGAAHAMRQQGHVAYVADMVWFDAEGVAPPSCLPLAPADAMRFPVDPYPWH
jgi:hypothetical protein